MTVFYQASVEEVPDALQILTSAYHEDGVADIHSYLMNLALNTGIFLLDENQSATAVFLPPIISEPTEVTIRSKVNKLLSQSPAEGEVLEKLLDTSWSLESIAVRPEQQGKKLGSKILQTGIEWIAQNDPQALVSILVTNPTAVPFFLKAGFLVAETLDTSDGGRNWALVCPVA